MCRQITRYGDGVVAVAIHAQRQRLHALQQQERIHRRQRRAGVAQWHGARVRNECGGTEIARVDDAVIGRLRLAEHRERSVENTLESKSIMRKEYEVY